MNSIIEAQQTFKEELHKLIVSSMEERIIEDFKKNHKETNFSQIKFVDKIERIKITGFKLDLNGL